MDVLEKRNIEDEATAADFFVWAKNRLLNVNRLTALAGSELSKFQLTDAFGNPIEGIAKEGGYLQIDIPGPGPTPGKDYDWGCIQAVIEEEEIGMRDVT